MGCKTLSSTPVGQQPYLFSIVLLLYGICFYLHENMKCFLENNFVYFPSYCMYARYNYLCGDAFAELNDTVSTITEM